MRSLVLVLLLAGCPSPPPPNPIPHDADGATLPTPENACASMRSAGCLEGFDVHCVDVLSHVVDSGLTPVDLPCLVGAATKEAMRACKGGPDCP